MSFNLEDELEYIDHKINKISNKSKFKKDQFNQPYEDQQKLPILKKTITQRKEQSRNGTLTVENTTSLAKSMT